MSLNKNGLLRAGKPPKSLEKRWEAVDLSRPITAIVNELGVTTLAVSARKRKMKKTKQLAGIL